MKNNPGPQPTAIAPKLEVVESVQARNMRVFKTSPDVENFYRFLYENDLRKEARLVLERVLEHVHSKKKKSKGRNIH